MFPIRDHNPSRSTPYVTWGLITVNVIVFASYWSLFSNDFALAQFFYRWGLVPAISEPSTFITSMFLHGGLLHIAGNMLFLWVFGDNMEDAMGHGPFLGFYLAGGLAAAFAQYLADPTSTVPMVGASGAIAGVMGGYLLLYPKARVDILIILIIIIRIIPVPAWIVLSAWMGIQVVQGAVSETDAGGVAYWAHAGGFIAGAIMTLPLWLKLGGPRFWERHIGQPPHPVTNARLVRTYIQRVRRRSRRASPWEKRR